MIDFVLSNIHIIVGCVTIAVVSFLVGMHYGIDYLGKVLMKRLKEKND